MSTKIEPTRTFPVGNAKVPEEIPLKQKSTKNQKVKLPKTNKEDKVSRLEQYAELDKNHPLNKPFQGKATFRGPVFKRKFTNLYCVFVFLAFNAAFLLYGIVAWKDGSAKRLTNGLDFRAEICGFGKLKHKRYQYYAIPSIDINVKFCVESCPSTSGQQICLYDVNPNVLTPFCYTQSATVTSGINCIPTEPNNRKIVEKYLSKAENLIKRIAGDFNTTVDVMALGLVFALLMAAIFFHLMLNPHQIKFITWGSVWGTVVAIGVLAGLLYREYIRTIDLQCIQKIEKHGCGGFQATIFKIACYVCIGIAVLYLLLIMKIFNRINLGIGVLKAAAACSNVIHQIRAFPWILSIFAILVTAFFFIIIIFGFSVGRIVLIAAKDIDGGIVKTIIYNDFMRYLILFNFFMFQWWLNVILLIGDCVWSYAISMWYFEKRKETVILPVSSIIKNVLKFHLGTIIMLSLFKIIFRPFRAVINLFTLLMKKPKQHNDCVRFFQACCCCCIHAYERFFRYHSKHALVQMIIWSESFSVSSRRAFFLIFRHKHQISNLDSLCTFILFLSKVVCALFGGLFVYVYISVVPKTPGGINTSQVETPLAPTILVFYCSFFCASVFQSVLDMINKTLLQCYLMDEEMFTGEQRFAEKRILHFIDFYKLEGAQENKFGKLERYVKGLKATLDPGVQMGKEEDPDEEANKKFEKAKKKTESESEDEDDVANRLHMGAESEEDDDDDEDESESDEDELADSNFVNGQVFAKQPQKDVKEINIDYNNITSESAILQASIIHISPHHASPVNDTPSQFKASKFVDHTKFAKSNEEVGEESVEESVEEEAKSTMFFKKPRAPEKQKTNDKGWKPLETSALSHSISVDKSQQGLLLSNKGSEQSVLNINDMSGVQPKHIEKQEAGNTTVKADVHNIFNKSKIANNTTMKLEYDDDEEANMKYRL